MKTSLTAFIFLSLVMLTSAAKAQDEETEGTKGFDKSRLFFGGNLAMSFGNSTFVNVSPQVGYRFNSWLAAGTGVNFIYANYVTFASNGQKLYRDEYGYAGLNIFARLYPIRFLFLSAQPELNYSWGKTKFYYNTIPDLKLDPKFVPSFLVGIGGALPAGNGAIILGIQYDVIQDARSPYGRNPFFTMGFNF